MKTTLFMILLSVGWLLACKTSSNGKSTEKASEQSNDQLDVELIKEWVKDKRIVSLGESTHGIGEFFALKSEIVQYLHEELGFDVLAFEGGFGDINLVWLNADEMNHIELRDKSLFGNFRCKEVEPLFQYIQLKSDAKNPLMLAGIDPQVSGSFYEDQLKKINALLNLRIDVEEEFAVYNQLFQATFQPDSTIFNSYKNRYETSVRTFIDEIEKNRSRIMDSLHFNEVEMKIIQKTLSLQLESVDYSWDERMDENYFPKAMETRDALMAQNIEWLLENVYPDEKIIIWGHNVHVQSGPFNASLPKFMGEHLKEKYGDDYFSIGLFAYKGALYQHGNAEALSFEHADSNYIEQLMSKGALNYSYANFSTGTQQSWMNQPVQAFEYENNGIVTFVPATRFDAAICILEGNVPTFE